MISPYRGLGFLCIALMLCAGFAPARAAGLPTETAQIQAASCSRSDVQAALNVAADGDTVLIPAGTCEWNQGIALDTAKAITLRGAGIDQTVIVDDINKEGGGGQVLTVNTQAGKRFRMTGITFRGKAQDSEVYNHGTLLVYGTGDQVRLDHLKFDQPGTSAIRFGGAVFGLIDHCYFNLPNFKQGVIVFHDGWDGKQYGDGSFAAPLMLGSPQAIYIEDNIFIGPRVAGAGPLDALGGGRFVFRYNSVQNDVLATHGTESSGRYRGVRSYEIYNNTFSANSLLFTGIYLRGGTGVVWGNTFLGAGGQTGYQSAVRLANYRSSQSYNPWGQCNGSNPWDGNAGPQSGYPCLDQVGRGQSSLIAGDNPTPVGWPSQASEPLYIWGNTWDEVPNNPGELVSIQHNVIQQNRDYFLNAKPGYMPYLYPHPLNDDLPVQRLYMPLVSR